MVLAGLIITALIYPNSFSNLKNNFNDVLPKFFKANKEITRLVPSQMHEYYPFQDTRKNCVEVELFGIQNDLPDIKNLVCRESCAKRKLNYYSNVCERDLLVCYCY